MFKIGRLAVALVMVTGALAPTFFATPAQAATCYGSTCTGKDPQTSGCSSDASTLTSFVDGDFYVEMRYSPTCYAAWTRVSSPSGTPGAACNFAFAQIRAYGSSDNFLLNYGVQALCPGQTWTRMISFAYYVRSCLAYDFNGTPYVCTNRR